MMLSTALAMTLAQGSLTVTKVAVFDQFKAVSYAAAPTGSVFAASLDNGDVRLMNAATKATVINLKGHPQPAFGLAFSPNGKELVSGDETTRIFVWDVKTGKKLREFPRGQMNHGRGIGSISFSTDGKTLYTTGKDDVIIVWDYTTMKPKARIAGNGVVFASAFPIKNGLIVGTLTEGMHFRTARTFALGLKAPAHGGLGINELAINAARTKVASAGRDNRVGIWDVNARKVLGMLPAVHTDWVQRVALSPNGMAAASSSNDRNVIVWNLKAMSQASMLGDQSAVGAPLVFTGDGKFLISSTINDGVQINSVSPAQGVPAAPVRRRR